MRSPQGVQEDLWGSVNYSFLLLLFKRVLTRSKSSTYLKSESGARVQKWSEWEMGGTQRQDQEMQVTGDSA
jgi:hypothetical protein